MADKQKKNNYFWDLKPLLRSETVLFIKKNRQEIKNASQKFAKKWKTRTDYLQTPKILQQALVEYENFQKNFGAYGKEYHYFHLLSETDENSPIVKAKLGQAREFSLKIQDDLRFFELDIAKIAPEKRQKFLDYSGLKNYQHFLEMIFAQAKYLLSEPEEKILENKNSVAHTNWVKMTSGFLAKEEKTIKIGKMNHQVSLSALLSLLNDRNKNTRDAAAAGFNDILEKYSDVAEAEINSILADKKINDELRGFARPDQSRHLQDDIESKTVDTMIEAVVNKFSVAHGYYHLKARLLGVKKLAYHERNVPIGRVDKKYSFIQAVDLTKKTFARLDPKFAEIFEKFLLNRQIDVFPRKGKTSGAFCSYGLLVSPIYILLNFTGELHDVQTLAHELGHGINDELMKEKRNALDFGSSTATAEVASTFMEDFILEEVVKGADDHLKLAIIMQKLNNDVTSIFRQAACYKFEQELHGEFRAKGYLSKIEIGKIFLKHMAAYMGPAVAQDPGSQNWWIYWSHIRNYFYVYSYASGLLISKSLQLKAKKDPAFIENVKEFMSAGHSDSPRNIFKNLGIDMNKKEFWNQGLNQVEILLAQANKLANKLSKTKK